MTQSVLVQTIIVGIVTLIVDLFVFRALTGYFPTPKLNYFYSMILGGFMIGSIVYLIYVYSGTRKLWCSKLNLNTYHPQSQLT